MKRACGLLLAACLAGCSDDTPGPGAHGSARERRFAPVHPPEQLAAARTDLRRRRPTLLPARIDEREGWIEVPGLLEPSEYRDLRLAFDAAGITHVSEPASAGKRTDVDPRAFVLRVHPASIRTAAQVLREAWGFDESAGHEGSRVRFLRQYGAFSSH